ncbi:Gfo/Idh/MocA family protein [Actinomycetota bacterium]
MTRVGLAGYGMAGRDIHAPALRRAGLEVVAVSTGNPERAEQVHGEIPGAVVVPDLDALLAEDVDLVVLATPTGNHLAHALACVEARRPFVIDKPLAVDADQALEIVDAATHNGVPFTVFHNRRFDAQHTTLAEVLRDGVLGEVHRAEMRWERWRPEHKERWRESATPAEGGGILLDLGAHLVDGAVQLFGEVQQVYAELASRLSVAEDEAFLACRHVSGVVSHLGATSLAGAPGPRVRVLGSAGAYVLDGLEEERTVFPDLADGEGQTGWVYRGDQREAVASVPADQADFYRAVAGALASDDPQAHMPVDPRDAVHTAAVLDAARISAEGRRVVDVITPGERID